MGKTLICLGVCVFMMTACSSEKKGKDENITVNTSQKKKLKDYAYFLERISTDPDWMLEIEKRAVELDITVEKALRKNANYMAIQNGHKAVEIKDSELELQIRTIKNNKEWFDNVKNEAEKRGLSLDSMLVRAAKYTIDNRK